MSNAADNCQGTSPTAAVLDRLALHGAFHGDGDSDHRHSPADEDIECTLTCLFEAMSGLLTGSQLEGDLEELLWSMTNVFHQRLLQITKRLDDTDASLREMLTVQDGSEVKSVELERLQAFVEADMQAGALGLSTGLFYRPGSYANTEEVIALARVAARYDGVYDSHLRDESSYNIGLLGATGEAIRIAEEAGLPVHIAHLKALGRDVWGQSGDIIGLVAAARERGVVVTADQYPYRASGTRFSSALIPRWAMADSREAMFERLANADLRDRIHEEMEQNLWRRGGADSLLVTGDSEWRGMTLDEIALELDMGATDAAIEVVRSGNPSIASFNMNPDDISAIAIQPWVMTGSDGSHGHPRKYASYPKAYRDFVVDTSLMGMPQFVHRSSGLVADTFGLCDRGYLAEGKRADIAILELDRFRPVADFENPTELATGVVHLLVNGQAAIRDGEITRRLAGEVIHRQNIECSQ